MSEDSLRGQLLIAAPQLSDYFRRTVVLVVEHTDEGAMGVVLNRPTETAVAEAVPALAELAEPDDVIHAGGPVAPDAVIALGDFEEPDQAGTPVAGSLGLVDPERRTPRCGGCACSPAMPGGRRASSTGAGGQEAWIVGPVGDDDPFTDDDLWPDALQRKGGAYALLATMPVDPSLN